MARHRQPLLSLGANLHVVVRPMGLVSFSGLLDASLIHAIYVVRLGNSRIAAIHGRRNAMSVKQRTLTLQVHVVGRFGC
jgi:hypothetical protein